ncbi:aldehyde dehydrogenase [Desulfospira joergensenii]|uniref:aldehyde dehydrogenase n=1 Tax=Desulfospira joergensenii TaxID=53329 RepID=UPI0003B5DB9C|nr:aldehyde dehydrogenase [Desulfospira joergensenii]
MKDEIVDIVGRQHRFFRSSITHSYDFRIEQLRKLKTKIKKAESRLNLALKEDLGKSEFEAYATEVGFILHDLTRTIKRLKKWMKPRRISTPLLCQPASSHIRFTPLGVNLIIAPFNYPVALTFVPLASAMAAGNTAVVKTSELTPKSSAEMEELIQETFDPEYIAYIPGKVPETTLLLEQKFDHIFFTGSPRVGSIVMQAAARHLTPVTLELGGKSPCIVHSDADLKIAVNRIVYGKFMNAGQSCIAPDYVLVHKKIKQDFLTAIKKRILDLYGRDASLSPDYGRIINKDHHARIVNLIDPDKVVVGGTFDQSKKYIAPTVMTDVTLEDKIMTEEIFGPVLPVLEYSGFDEIYEIIGQLPQHPLACYIFSRTRAVQEEVISKIRFGGGCVNHCIQHLVNPNLPFGGVGESGIGSYHGFNGFETFSHKKSILKAATWIDLPLAYPPYRGKLNLVRRLLK